MAVLASLGTINFNLNENDFNRYRRAQNYRYAQQPKLLGKPALQAVGDALDTIALNFLGHNLNSDPDTAIANLRELAISKEPQAFIFKGEFLGYWVITRFRESPDKLLISNSAIKSGNTNYSVELLEFIGEVGTVQTDNTGFQFSN